MCLALDKKIRVYRVESQSFLLLPPRRCAPRFTYPSWPRETLDTALAEYNVANAVMDLVLFDEVSLLVLAANLKPEAIRACRILPRQ